MKGCAVYRCKMCSKAFTVPYEDIAKGFDELVQLGCPSIPHACLDNEVAALGGVAELVGWRASKTEEPHV